MEAGSQGSEPAPAQRAADQPFTCTICGNSFSRSHSLQQHLRIHAGERAFTETSYVRTIAPASWQRVKVGERLFVCDVCGQRFTIASFLERHQRGHTAQEPLECDLCGQTFASAANHREHRQQHAREPTDLCEVCGGHYPGPQRLARHRRTHLLPEPHLCSTCGMSFGRLHYLQWHQRIHASGAPGAPQPRPVTSTSPTRKIPPLEAGGGAAGATARGRKRRAEQE